MPQQLQTMWGWIAWQIDPEKAFPIVAEHDKDRVSPGGDVIRDLLTKGAGGRPVLILLGKVLKYMKRSAAVSVLDSTLQRQAKGFFQNLTVEVAGGEKAALVYSLTWSAREALGNQVFKAFPAIANLADKSDGARVRIRIEGSSAAGFDPSWLRNAVDEPLDETDIERSTEE